MERGRGRERLGGGAIIAREEEIALSNSAVKQVKKVHLNFSSCTCLNKSFSNIEIRSHNVKKICQIMPRNRKDFCFIPRNKT